MIGEYGEGTNPAKYRDLAEYATMVMLSNTFDSLQKQGNVPTPERLQRFRDEWTRNGQPMDFATMKANTRDFANLLALTGADDYGKLGKPGDDLTSTISEAWTKARETYNKAFDNGIHMHVITDPEIRDYIFDQKSGAPINKAIFAHRGKSLREMNPGDAVALTTRKDATPFYNGVVKAAPVAAATQPAVQAAQIPPAFEVDEFETNNEMLLGWEGGTVDGTEHRGLNHIFGAFLTKADIDAVSKNIDANQKFSPDVAYNTLELLTHMRSQGYNFKVQENSKENKINLSMGDGVTVRAFDPDDNGKYVGRVYDRFNTYYIDVSGDKATRDAMEYTTEDATRVIDYVMGNAAGKVQKFKSGDASKVTFTDLDQKKHLRVVPSTRDNDIYRALKYNSVDEAREFIEDGIDKANVSIALEFKAEEMQALMDKGLDDENILVSSQEFKNEFESLYSLNPVVREAQERAVEVMKHSDDKGLQELEAIRDDIVGDFDNGFNPAVVLDQMGETQKGNNRDALMSAMKYVDYDMSKVKGNDFAVNAMKERLIAFDPETAKSIDEVDHPMLKEALQTVQDTLKDGKFVGREGWGSKPEVKIDANGIVQWEANRHVGAKGMMWQELTGEIGQVMVPDEHGIIKTQFAGDNNYGIVPGYTGYFSFEGDFDDRMSRFRAKGFDQHLNEQLKAKVTHQMTRPYDKVLENIPTTLDASSLNGLYHGDVYGKRIETDFMEANQLPLEDKEAILQTLSNRVRFDNQYSDYATTSAETQANREIGAGDNTSEFSYWKAAGETNMRVLDKDIENYADLTMTGTGKTQGLIWYLTDGAKVNEDGSVTPSEGMVGENGELVPDKTALKKLSYFDDELFNAWDRTQMSANQLMTALKVEQANVAFSTLGGWTFDDGFAISKEFAEKSKVKGATRNEDSQNALEGIFKDMNPDSGRDLDDLIKETEDATGMKWTKEVLKEGAGLYDTIHNSRNPKQDVFDAYDAYLDEHATFRPLQRGDKQALFGGDKGLIGIVVDRDMDPDKATREGLEKEIEFFKANPDLEVVAAPYSMLSRHNAGIAKEAMRNDREDLFNPHTGGVMKGAQVKMNVIISDMLVDKKTQAYGKEAFLDGKGRKASGQLSWALQAKDATKTLTEVYGHNDQAWSTYREYLITTGLDMKADGTLTKGYTPHADEDRHHFQYDADVSSGDFLNEIQSQGGMLDMPFEMEFKTGAKTTEIPVLSASLRQNVELVDGSMRRSDFTNSYEKIYNAIGDYETADVDADREKAQQSAQKEFDKIQSTIIDRQFEGGHNGKHSYIRDKIMSKRMPNSATAVAMPDPRLDIGVAGMNQEMLDAINAKEGDHIMMWRDPVWRDGAIRAMEVKLDPDVHGVSFNPITDKSHDGDFDGDTYGIIKFDNKEVTQEIVDKFSHWSNMIDKGNGKDELYFQSGMDLASAKASAEKVGDTSGQRLYDQAVKQAQSEDPRVLKNAEQNLSNYAHKMFRGDHGFGSDYISFESDETVKASLKQMMDNGAKGNTKAYDELLEYYDGKKTMDDARLVQYATGVKSDDTGLAGGFTQKAVAVARNMGITSATESMYSTTQGTLQVKKDAKKARVTNEVLTDDLQRVFQAKHLDDPRSDAPMTKRKFVKQLQDTIGGKLGVEVADEHFENLADALSVNNKVLPLKEAMAIKAAPMDRVAYGGGFEELKRIADKEESLLTGKYNALYAPLSMRNATESTKIVKRDTQRVVQAVAEEPNFGVDTKASAVSRSSSPSNEAAHDTDIVM